MSPAKLKNWHGELDADKIYWLYIDVAKSSANVLSKKVLEELSKKLGEVKSLNPKGLVILSGKESGFIAGADVKEFVAITDKAEGLALIKSGQAVMDEIASLPFTTVSAISGFCLGGGMELALACDYRVADYDPKTKLGLPEVKLGIHPGFGGTVRLSKLLGGITALPIMLTGRMVSVREAKKIGLVDVAVPLRHLKTGARQAVLKPPKRKKLSALKRLADISFVRPYTAKMIRKNVKAKAKKEHYPAPYAIIDLWEKYFGSPSTMYKKEAESVANLITSETSKNLVNVFFLQERLKSIGGSKSFKPQSLHVIGAGVMGGDIAAWSALKGMSVTLEDREPKFIAPAMKRAHKLFTKKLKEKRLVQSAMDRLMPDVHGHGAKTADVIIEAIFENLEAKQELFKRLEKVSKKSAVLATNTSSIPIDEIASVLKNPERLAGIHFFNPVAQMMLVEVVKGDLTSDKIVENSFTYVQKIGKLPLPVKSAPGFLVNRILVPYLLEGVELVVEGVAPEKVDKSAVDFGMPMGPITLADTVGLDICLHVAEVFSKYMEIKIPDKLKTMVEKGDLGKKSGKGFYNYKDGKPEKNEDAEVGATGDIEDRLIFRYLNESVACLREGIVEDADLLDAGMIFGTGFAPFKGGPMSYIKSKEKSYFAKKFKELESKHGIRFKADAGFK